MTTMHYQCFMFWIVFVGFLPFHICLDQASFYGGSYISVPLKEAKSSTDIHFKFRTHLSNTLLFLVAGTTDYCIITLDNGMLKIIINLGAGENDLYCEGVKLNNFKWHNVYIIRKDGNFSVIINDIYKFQKHVSGDFFELNIHFGIFIGSLGNRTDLFFGHMNNFRGCLAEFSYNGMSVLEQARNRQSQSTVHGVTWNCAAEFEAPNDRAISFVEDSSFMAVTHPISDNMKLQLELKTVFTTRLIVYNTGWKMDHFALEIWEGKVKATWKHDDIVVEIVNDEYVSDGHWHKIALKMNSNMTELRVDQKTKVEKFPQKLYFFLTDTFYIGGLEKSKQSRAVAKGLKQFGSLNGCLRHLSIGDKVKGLADVHISEGLLPGCVWQFACLSNPCINNSTCYQMGIDSFKCFCRNKVCSNATKVFSKPSFATELELLALEPLKILEGQNILITTNNLHVILDYPKYGIKDSGIVFIVVEAPSHGSVSIDVWPKKENVFTLADVAKDKVHYVHDGTESRADHIGLEVHFEAGELFILPNYLQGKYKFTLAINVAPVNDPPTLKISSTDVLRVAQCKE